MSRMGTLHEQGPYCCRTRQSRSGNVRRCNQWLRRRVELEDHRMSLLLVTLVLSLSLPFSGHSSVLPTLYHDLSRLHHQLCPLHHSRKTRPVAQCVCRRHSPLSRRRIRRTKTATSQRFRVAACISGTYWRTLGVQQQREAPVAVNPFD
jgi:hypothetical protein